MKKRSIINDHLENQNYQRYFDEWYAPQKYLITMYPSFYKDFSSKYKKILLNFTEQTKLSEKELAELNNRLFLKNCFLIKFLIDSDDYYKYILLEKEKKRSLRKPHGKHNIKKSSYEFILNFIFELPELIIESYKPGKSSFTRLLEKYKISYEGIKLFVGNPIEKRKSMEIYKKVSKYWKVISEEFSIIKNPLSRACDINDCKYNSFTTWKYRRKENKLKINNWQNEMTNSDFIEIVRICKNYFDKYKIKYEK